MNLADCAEYTEARKPRVVEKPLPEVREHDLLVFSYSLKIRVSIELTSLSCMILDKSESLRRMRNRLTYPRRRVRSSGRKHRFYE
jgi:hypothetical protein